ncbi:MAG: calcium/sodium antiporter [Planctomycetota bacterium]|nr:calcium/sodium antiporter [Planctomycetota bacterium]
MHWELPLVSHGIVLVCGLVVLAKSADWFVDASCRSAKRLGVSELVIGLTVVAFGTSAPEFLVSAVAAVREHDNLSVANVVGSNIFNLGFILGLCALIRPMKATRMLVYRDGAVLIGITGLLVISLIDLTISRWEGIVFFSVLLGYLALLWRQRDVNVEEIPQVGEFKSTDILIMLGSLALLLGSSHLLVISSVEIAREFGLSEWLIGVTIIAAGTSLPELVTSLVASIKGRHALSAGNLIGSDIFNIMGVLGFAAILRPLAISPVSRESVYTMMAFMPLVVLVLRSGWELSRTEGIILLCVSASRWARDILLG